MAFGSEWHLEIMKDQIESLVRASQEIEKMRNTANDEKRKDRKRRAEHFLKVAEQHRQARNHEGGET